jgi:outer membrane protein TolC
MNVLRSRSHVRAALLALAALFAALHDPAPAAADGGAWTADRVLAAVRERDPSVRAARAEGAAGRAQASQMWAMLLPHVSLSSGFTRTDDPAVLFSQKLWQGRFTPADFDVNALNQPAPQSALQWGVTVDQPLFNGARELSAPGLAARYGRAATAMERANVAGRLLAALEAYAGAVKAREDARAAELGLEATNSMRESALARFGAGQVPELDTLRAAARAADARVRAIGARRALVVALDHLSRIVGETVTAGDLAAPDDPGPPPAGVESGRGELIATREMAAAASTEARIAALRLLPSLNGRLAATQYRPWDGETWERRWLVAVMAELPVFDGGQRIAEWRTARARAEAARAKAAALERDMATGLAAARVEEEVSRERREAARAGRAAAEEAVRLSERRYRAGLIPLTEFLAADAEASAARAAEIDASNAVLLAHYRLLNALGELR